MSVYIGPCSYGAPEPDSGERFITADSNNAPDNTISVVGDLDMKKHRIINVKAPREDEPSDATTVEYVGRVASSVFNKKVDWGGGTMTGELSMGSHKITDVEDPENNKDVVNKQYLNTILQQTKPYDLGRYLVFPHADNTKSYFAVGSKRNVDLDADKVFEIFNDEVHDPQNILVGDLDRTLIPVRGKNEVLMHLNSQHVITPNLIKPWTFIFSTKPDNPPQSINDFILDFGEQAPGVRNNITISWTHNTFTYTISGQDSVMIDINTSKLNHFVLEYVNRKLIVWLNGASRKTHSDITLNAFQSAHIGVNFIGVVSVYNRELSKLEIIEHFVKHHVKPFTDDEVFS